MRSRRGNQKKVIRVKVEEPSLAELATRKIAVIPMWPAAAWGASGGTGKHFDDPKGTMFKEIKLELRSKPSDAKSHRVGAYFKIFENGTPEQWCRWRDDLLKAWTGLNNTSASDKIATVRLLLEGQPLDDFERALKDEEEVQGGSDKVKYEESHVTTALKYVAIGLFPADAVTRQKSYLNYEANKPNKLSARETATRLKRLNDWFEYFPSDGGLRLADVNKIESSELVYIYYNRLMPTSWKRKVDEQNVVSPFKDGLATLVDFAERIQIAEERYGAFPAGSVSKGSAVKPRSAEDKSSGNSYGGPASGSAKRGEFHERNNKGGSKNCLIHGDNCGHGSHNCKVLQSHATKYRAAWDSKPRNKYPAAKKHQDYKHNKKTASGDRTWTRAEVQAIVKNASRLENHNVENVVADPMDQDKEDFDKYLEDCLSCDV